MTPDFIGELPACEPFAVDDGAGTPTANVTDAEIPAPDFSADLDQDMPSSRHDQVHAAAGQSRR